MGQKSNISKIAFFSFLFLFPFGEVVRLPLLPNVSIHPSDIAIGIIAICSIPYLLKNKKHYLFRPMLLVSGVFLLSLLVNIFSYDLGQLFVAVLYYIRFVFLLLFFLVVSSLDASFKKRTHWFLTIVGFIIVSLGYVQYFFYPNLRNLYYAGWDEHLYRMFSTFLDPNFAGAFFVMYFMFVTTRFRIESGMTGRMLYGLLSFITLGAILLTYSRSAYLMLGVSLLVFLLLQRQKKLLFGLLGVVLLIPILFFFSPKSEGTNLFRTTSSNARLVAMQQAITIIKDNPIFGVGFNAYRYAQEKKGFLIETSKENHAGAGTDNSFLFVLATTGIVGFGVYLYFWYVILKKTHKDAVIFATVIGLFVNAMFINSLFYPPIMAFLWIELGLVTDYKQQ